MNSPEESAPQLERKVKAILFGDVVRFSKLPEYAIPLFIDKFLGGLAEMMSEADFEWDSRNTWGDAIYMIFDDVETAGEAALAIRDWVENQPWVSYGFPSPLRMRIGLHAGPVYHGWDAILESECFMGSNTSRAARIEPIVDEGQIFASEEFAAVAEAQGVESFLCDYQGQADLPKKSGHMTVYMIRKTS